MYAMILLIVFRFYHTVYMSGSILFLNVKYLYKCRYLGTPLVGEKQMKTDRGTAWGAETSAQVYNDDAVREERNKRWRSRLLAESLHLSPGG